MSFRNLKKKNNIFIKNTIFILIVNSEYLCVDAYFTGVQSECLLLVFSYKILGWFRYTGWDVDTLVWYDKISLGGCWSFSIPIII